MSDTVNVVNAYMAAAEKLEKARAEAAAAYEQVNIARFHLREAENAFVIARDVMTEWEAR